MDGNMLNSNAIDALRCAFTFIDNEYPLEGLFKWFQKLFFSMDSQNLSISNKYCFDSFQFSSSFSLHSKAFIVRSSDGIVIIFMIFFRLYWFPRNSLQISLIICLLQFNGIIFFLASIQSRQWHTMMYACWLSHNVERCFVK